MELRLSSINRTRARVSPGLILYDGFVPSLSELWRHCFRRV